MSESKAKPWDKQPKEPAKAFAAFKKYLSLGEGRTLKDVGSKRGRTGRGAKAQTCLSEWSVEWNWVERAAQYDTAQHEETLHDLRKVRRDAIQQLAGYVPGALETLEELSGNSTPKDTVRLKAALAILDRVGVSPMVAQTEAIADKQASSTDTNHTMTVKVKEDPE